MHLAFGIVWILLIIAVQRQILMFLASLSLEYETNRYSRVMGWPTEFFLHLNADQSLTYMACRFDFRKSFICLLTAPFLKMLENRKALPYTFSLKVSTNTQFWLSWEGAWGAYCD